MTRKPQDHTKPTQHPRHREGRRPERDVNVTGTAKPHRNTVLQGARWAGRALLRLLASRLAILAEDVAEERYRLAKLALVAVAVIVSLPAAMVLSLVFLLLLVGPEHRLVVIGSAALVLLLGGLGGLLWMRAWLKQRPALFGGSIAELRKDADGLGLRS